MSSDLDYFHENVMNNGSLNSFCQSLPNDLRIGFENSLHASISRVNILRGYRGPEHMQNGSSDDSGILAPSDGLIVIKFQWGIRKWMNVLTFGLALYLQKKWNRLNWSSLYFDSNTGQCFGHDKDEAAERLNSKGNQLLEDGQYTAAIEYYNNAYKACSSGYSNAETFKDNAKKAQLELRAADLNSQGDALFREGKYDKAVDKYKEAHSISQVGVKNRMYEANRRKAQDELDAIDVCSQADSLFEQERYIEAESKYQEAYNKSQVQKQKAMYKSKIDKVRTITKKLKTLETLWNQAWDAENNDRDAEGTKLFQKMLGESKCSLELSSGHSRMKKFESIVSSKLKGNEAFNRALKLQEYGNSLIEEARELNCPETYESAKMKFEEAINYLREASEHFQTGCQSDERFEPCVEIVKDQIDEIMRSVEITKKRMLTSIYSVDMNTGDNNANTDSYEFVNSNECNDLFQLF